LIVASRLVYSGSNWAAEILAWNGAAWRSLGSGMTTTTSPLDLASVRALAVYDGELIAGGTFFNAGGVSANSIARWNGSTWRPLGSGIGGPVYALTVYNGELIAGGDFATVGGVTCNNIARWDGSVWRPLGSGIEPSYARVDALAVYNGELVAGGYFTTAGGVTCNNIARWNGLVWQPLRGGMNDATAHYVVALTVYHGELVVGGYFNLADNVSVNNIARWNGSVWRPLGDGMNGDVDALVVHDDELVAGGSFTTAGGQVSAYWARWWNIISQDPVAKTVYVGQSAQFSVTVSETGSSSYQWRKDGAPLADGDNIAGATTDTLTINPAGLADAGNYDVLVVNGCHSEPSAPAELAVHCPPGDFDCDGDVDQADFGHFQVCFSGDTVPQNGPECAWARLDGDSDVDQLDLAWLQRCLSGADVLVDPNCAE
jgi:hypothetical protein